MLSSFLQYPFLDTDEMIEEVTGQKIADIFEQQGEEAFREMETQILQVIPLACCCMHSAACPDPQQAAPTQQLMSMELHRSARLPQRLSPSAPTVVDHEISL